MKLLPVIILSIFFYGCNSSATTEKKITDTAKTTTEIVDGAKIDPVKIDVKAIPASIDIFGKAQEVWQWKDKLGENLLITSITSAYSDKGKNNDEEDGQTAELYAFHYVKKDGDYVLLWKMKDAERSCPFDLTVEFAKGSTTITDLDDNGIAETKIQYALACRSDVSPALMKLIMHENTKAYSLQGTMWLAYSPDMKYEVTIDNVNLEKQIKPKDEEAAMIKSFGRYENDKSFTDAPPSFLSFAKNEWLKYSKEKLGE